jgi:signal transduction histidine kinase
LRWRLRSVRTRILLLVLVPVLSLVGVYAFAVSITARDAVSLSKANTVKNALGVPAGAFLAQVGIERMLAVVYMSAPSGANLAKLELQETRTNAATAALRTALTSSSVQDNASPTEKHDIAALLRAAASLPSLRAQVAAQIIPSSRALAEYNAVIQSAYGALNSAIRQQSTALVVSQAQAFVRMGQSGDMLSQENTLLTAAASSGKFPRAQLQQFTQLVGSRRSFYNLTLPDLDPRYRAYYLRDVSPRALTALAALEDTVISSTPPGSVPPVSPVAWQQAVGAVGSGLTAAGNQAADAIASQADADSRATYLRLFLVGGLGLIAIIVSIVLSLLIGRRQVRELSALRQSALELSNERLPEVVRRLAAGEEVDVSPQSLHVSATSDEVQQVGEAFGRVQQTAVEAAVGQARLRQGISHIFRNLARRSQSLLHRQLTLLDAMERRASDPQELDDLFRVDHLATRMRRHAESLIILSGEAPARGWRHPVPLVDVLRAAVAEVEDYTRIKVTATTDASLAGPAVGDVIHMIAELAENATIYSPPQTPVSITGSIVGQGFAVEIEDRGLGMSTAHRDEANAQLENPPAFDLSGSDQLGLFVAGQLAKRQNIRITLRPSPYGGTTAIVLIPRSLVIPEGALAKDTTPLPVGSGTQARARHAIGSGYETDGPDDGQSSTPAPPVPVSSGLRGEWGPAIDWPTASPAGSREDTDYRPLEYPDEETLARPDEFSPWRPAGGNGPGSAIPATAEDTPGTPLDASGLPRRVRQASLAQQLRNTPPRPAPSADLGALSDPSPSGWSQSERSADRSPEETRVTMSAIQRGWERGRSVFDPSRGNGEHTPEREAGSEAPGGTDTRPAADAMEGMDAGAAPAGTEPPAGAEQTTDEIINADSTAARTDGGGASGGTHRSED